MLTGHAILQKLIKATICRVFMPPHSISSFSLKISDIITAMKIKLLTVLEALVTKLFRVVYL